MGTVLGMMVMMPVVFGVGGYALVSRRPEVDAKTAKTVTGARSGRRQVSHVEWFVHLVVRCRVSALGGVVSRGSRCVDPSRGDMR
jgi:hypothetical protein